VHSPFLTFPPNKLGPIIFIFLVAMLKIKSTGIERYREKVRTYIWYRTIHDLPHKLHPVSEHLFGYQIKRKEKLK
jgi:hypothetical protein